MGTVKERPNLHSEEIKMPSVETILNNVFVRHPILGEGHLVPFGMYIQPANIHIGDVIVSGQKVVIKEEGGLADQAKLLVGDLLVALDDIFVDQKSLEDVLNLIKTLPPKFSMTVIRQDEPEAEGAPKYTGLKITIELGVDESKEVVVISSFCEKVVIYQYNQTVKSVKVWQELNNLTTYIKATSKTTVAMQTWPEQEQAHKDQYHFDLYVYNAVYGGRTAVVFYNEKYGASITVNGKKDGAIALNQNKAKPPTSLAEPTYSFFADNSTGTMFEFGFESILIRYGYMTTSNNDLLFLKKTGRDLPMASRYFMAMVSRK